MNDIRYGIFLRPDPATCWAVTQVTFALRQQYGLVAAAAFAPHATLIGNLRSGVDEPELVKILNSVFDDLPPFTVYNHGIRNHAYDINLDATGERSNQDLARVAAAVRTSTLPIHVGHDDYLAPNVQDYRFAAHLSLAGFDLHLDKRLSDEVDEFIRGLPVVVPASFVARWYTLFQFRADWRGHWWEDMPWRHVKSWEAR
jgi:hypothetical protein